MFRQSIAAAVSNGSFFDKFRNGLITIETELNKLERIIVDLERRNDQNLPTSYFNDSVILLDNIDEIHEECVNFFKTVNNSSINVDSVENKLLELREKLIKYDSNPVLLENGYTPFVPYDHQEFAEDNENNNDLVYSSKIDCEYVNGLDEQNVKLDQYTNPQTQFKEDYNQNYPESDCNESFNILSTINCDATNATLKKRKKDLTTIKNPDLKRAYSILNRLMDDDDDDEEEEKVISEKHQIKSDLNGKYMAHKNGDKTNNNYNGVDHRIESMGQKMSQLSFTPRSNQPTGRFGRTPVGMSRLNSGGLFASGKACRMYPISPSNRFGQSMEPTYEYETVEFTPGMTSKIRK